MCCKRVSVSVLPNSMPSAEFVSGTETACNILGSNSDTTIQLRSDCVCILKDSKFPKSSITKEERSALCDLKSDDTILILPANKGRTTVILNTNTYYEKSQVTLTHISVLPRTQQLPTATSSSVCCNRLETVVPLIFQLIADFIPPLQMFRNITAWQKFTRPYDHFAPLFPVVAPLFTTPPNLLKFLPLW